MSGWAYLIAGLLALGAGLLWGLHRFGHDDEGFEPGDEL